MVKEWTRGYRLWRPGEDSRVTLHFYTADNNNNTAKKRDEEEPTTIGSSRGRVNFYGGDDYRVLFFRGLALPL